MAWTSPRTMAAGTTGTAADWNTYVRDNENYLYGTLPYVISQSSYNSTTRQLNGTVYQNTTGKIMIVTATIGATVNSTSSLAICGIKCDSTNSPTAVVSYPGLNGTSYAAMTAYFPFSIVVQPNYYYSATSTVSGTASIALAQNWVESILH